MPGLPSRVPVKAIRWPFDGSCGGGGGGGGGGLVWTVGGAACVAAGDLDAVRPDTVGVVRGGAATGALGVGVPGAEVAALESTVGVTVAVGTEGAPAAPVWMALAVGPGVFGTEGEVRLLVRPRNGGPMTAAATTTAAASAANPKGRQAIRRLAAGFFPGAPVPGVAVPGVAVPGAAAAGPAAGAGAAGGGGGAGSEGGAGAGMGTGAGVAGGGGSA